MRLSHLVIHLISISSLIGLTLIQSGCASKEERIDSIAREAENALFENNQAHALKILSKGVAKFPDSSPLFEAYSDVLAENGQWENAADAMSTAIELDPLRKSLLIKLGEYKEQAGQIPAAIEALNEYVKFDPKDFLAWKKVYQLKTKSNDIDGAIEAALHWNRLRPSARPALGLGDLFLANGNSAQARAWYAQSAAYVDDTHAETALIRLITLEAQNQQYLQAETRINEYESRYGPNTNDQNLVRAKELIQRWRIAQEEMARAGQELLAQRESLQKKTQTPSEPQTQPTPETEQSTPDQNHETTHTPKPETTVAPTPLFETPPPADNTANAPITAPETSNQVASELTSIDALWNHLGEHPNDSDAWLQLAQIYATDQSWLDAEPCILQAKALHPTSEKITAEYLKIIAHTQAQRQVISDIEAHLRLFPHSGPIMLARADAFKTLKLNTQTVQQAYRDVLQIADVDGPEYNAAAQQLNTKN